MLEASYLDVMAVAIFANSVSTSVPSISLDGLPRGRLSFGPKNVVWE